MHLFFRLVNLVIMESVIDDSDKSNSDLIVDEDSSQAAVADTAVEISTAAADTTVTSSPIPAAASNSPLSDKAQDSDKS